MQRPINRFLITAVLLASVNAFSQTQISVSELPPEVVPVGVCTESNSGYLGIVDKAKKERTKLSTAEIGKYVAKSLAQGYSVTLYPQASGKIFTVATCHPFKPTAAASQ
jgi:hypothetical protein